RICTSSVTLLPVTALECEANHSVGQKGNSNSSPAANNRATAARTAPTVNAMVIRFIMPQFWPVEDTWAHSAQRSCLGRAGRARTIVNRDGIPPLPEARSLDARLLIAASPASHRCPLQSSTRPSSLESRSSGEGQRQRAASESRPARGLLRRYTVWAQV